MTSTLNCQHFRLFRDLWLEEKEKWPSNSERPRLSTGLNEEA
jgi:hypothetical protein